jgi:uncharacterized sporulation protein YeaH/YhbH (DUF444 family)
MLDGEDKHPPDQCTERDRRRHRRKQQADALFAMAWNGTSKIQAISITSSQPRVVNPDLPFYDTSRPRMHGGELGKIRSVTIGDGVVKPATRDRR